jgi:hypothetical protein
MTSSAWLAGILYAAILAALIIVKSLRARRVSSERRGLLR